MTLLGVIGVYPCSSVDNSPSPQPSPIKGEGVIMKFLLPWWEKARMRGISEWFLYSA